MHYAITRAAPAAAVRSAHKDSELMASPNSKLVHSVRAIVELLDRYHQRATYGAVAGLVRTSPRSVMQGRKRDWLHSWVVNQSDGLPSEYHELQIHPKLRERERILVTPDELREWLASPS